MHDQLTWCTKGPVAGVLNQEHAEYNLLNEEAQATYIVLAGSFLSFRAPTLGK